LLAALRLPITLLFMSGVTLCTGIIPSRVIPLTPGLSLRVLPMTLLALGVPPLMLLLLPGRVPLLLALRVLPLLDLVLALLDLVLTLLDLVLALLDLVLALLTPVAPTAAAIVPVSTIAAAPMLRALRAIPTTTISAVPTTISAIVFLATAVLSVTTAPAAAPVFLRAYTAHDKNGERNYGQYPYQHSISSHVLRLPMSENYVIRSLVMMSVTAITIPFS
jgi:hypothetical protein